MHIYYSIEFSFYFYLFVIYLPSLPYGAKPTYGEYVKGTDKRSFPSGTKHRGASTSKKDVAKKFSHREFKLYLYI